MQKINNDMQNTTQKYELQHENSAIAQVFRKRLQFLLQTLLMRIVNRGAVQETASYIILNNMSFVFVALWYPQIIEPLKAFTQSRKINK